MTYHLPGRNRSSARKAAYGSTSSSDSVISTVSPTVASAAASASSDESMSRASSTTASASGSFATAIASSTAFRSTSVSSTRRTARCSAGTTESSSWLSMLPVWLSSSSDDCSAAVAQSTSSRSVPHIRSSSFILCTTPHQAGRERRLPALLGSSENVDDRPAKSLIEHPDNPHHDQNTHKNNTRVPEQLLPGGGDNLPQFPDNLTQEEHDPGKRVPALCFFASRGLDEVLAWFVVFVACHLVYLPSHA